jgi:spore coat polysaccharide biosynthesis protein SpsF
MVDRVIARAAAAASIDDLWVATTTLPEDDPLGHHCRAIGVSVFRGSPTDVLGRYRDAARASEADLVIRLTADCPLLDPNLIDRVVAELVVPPMVDYASNVLERSFPRGLDIEAFTVEALARMDRLGTTNASREHVTLGPRLEHRAAFSVRGVRGATDDSDLRWTVDTADDLEFVRRVYHRLAATSERVSYQELVRWCRANDGWERHDTPAATWDPSRTAVALPGDNHEH